MATINEESYLANSDFELESAINIEFGKAMACSEIRCELISALCNIDKPDLEFKDFMEIVNRVSGKAERCYKELIKKGATE